MPPSGSSSTFAIRHYIGGETAYDLYSLLNANADTIADDIISTFKNKVRRRTYYHGNIVDKQDTVFHKNFGIDHTSLGLTTPIVQTCESQLKAPNSRIVACTTVSSMGCSFSKMN